MSECLHSFADLYYITSAYILKYIKCKLSTSSTTSISAPSFSKQVWKIKKVQGKQLGVVVLASFLHPWSSNPTLWGEWGVKIVLPWHVCMHVFKMHEIQSKKPVSDNSHIRWVGYTWYIDDESVCNIFWCVRCFHIYDLFYSQNLCYWLVNLSNCVVLITSLFTK